MAFYPILRGIAARTISGVIVRNRVASYGSLQTGVTQSPMPRNGRNRPMLTLYHYWSSVCSQKARLCLAEKGLEWESRHVDLFNDFDHWKPEYVALNRKAVVPTLDHDGRLLIESNVIIEYLDDAFPENPLKPDDPYERARMRLWIYDSEEIAHKHVNTASYNPRHAVRLATRYSADELATVMSGHPNPEIRERVVRRAREGVPPEEEEFAYQALGALLDRMEADLAGGPWLVGGMYTLANISMASYVNRIDALPRPEMLSPSLRPRVADWWQRLQARPGFVEAFSFPNPVAGDPMTR
jgi:glutathione S-transferase